jgi:hypothetical protein
MFVTEVVFAPLVPDGASALTCYIGPVTHNIHATFTFEHSCLVKTLKSSSE